MFRTAVTTWSATRAQTAPRIPHAQVDKGRGHHSSHLAKRRSRTGLCETGTLKLTPISIFMGRTALYRVDEFYESQDIAVLFGVAALRAVLREDVEFGVVHSDIASWSLKGLYESSSPHDEALFIAHGYNRDHRPDLRQFNHGLVVNGEGPRRSLTVWV